MFPGNKGFSVARGTDAGVFQIKPPAELPTKMARLSFVSHGIRGKYCAYLHEDVGNKLPLEPDPD